MEGDKQKVILVREGHWGWTKEGENDPLINTFNDVLKEEAVVKVVDTFEEVKKETNVDTIIFFSREMQEKAKELFKSMADRKKIKVIIVTGLIPADEIIYVEKGWLTTLDLIKDIVLRGMVG